MNKTAPSSSIARRALAVFLGLLLVPFLSGWKPAAARTQVDEVPALVRVELSGRADLERVAAAGIPVFAHLTAAGQEFLLAQATAAQQARISNQRMAVRVLDTGAGEATYYMIKARQAQDLERAAQILTLLDQVGNQAVGRGDTWQAEELLGLGMEIQRLTAHPLDLEGYRSAPDLPQVITPDPIIQTMINNVQQSTVFSYNGGLSGEWPVSVGGSPYTIATRYSRTVEPIDKATQYAYEHFQGLGLSPTYHSYNLPSTGTRRNVIAQQTGLTQPNRIFLITGHLDDTSQSTYRDTLAPGADDNASGSTAVLIAADILSQYDFGCTLRYALFTGEEQGLVGSGAYAAYVQSLNEDIQGVLNLDMISYDAVGLPYLDLHTRPANASDLAIANLFVDVVSAYNLNLNPQIFQDGVTYSDHASFWNHGYPAIIGIEDDDDFTPYYHTIADKLETLNMTYYTNFVRAAVGTFAHMGCLLEGKLQGTVTNSQTGNPLPGATVQARLSVNQSWSATTGANGFYQLPLPVGSYNVAVSAPQYATYNISGIPINANQTTLLNVPLQQGCYTVSGPDFSANPTQPQAGEAVTFSGSVSGSTTLPVQYSWNFGDGGTASGQVITHTFTMGGEYPVQMTASNCGGSATATNPVTVSAANLATSATAIDVTLTAGQPLTYTLTLSNTGQIALTWDMAEVPPVTWLGESDSAGTIQPGQLEEVVLTFTQPPASGTYTTTLQVESNDPDGSPLAIPVSLNAPCTALEGVSFTFAPESPFVGEPVIFQSSYTSGSGPVTYTWSFGDGTSPVAGVGLSQVVYAFPRLPTDTSYTVNLAVENECSMANALPELVWVMARRLFFPLVQLLP